MELKKIIDLAKKAAKKDYDDTGIANGTHNPAYKREWRSLKVNKWKQAFALYGTPDKAFVVVSEKKVYAVRPDKSIVKVFNID